jgi:DNA-binding MarR family transcriptional regulator
MRTRWLNEREERAWRGYRRMRALLDLQITRDLARAGLSDADYDVLSTLSEEASSSMRLIELSQMMLWSKSRLSHQARRMESRGLIQRQEETVGRAVALTLTAKGWTVLRDVAPNHVESVRQHFLNSLTPAQLDDFAEISALVIKHLSESIATEKVSSSGPTGGKLKIPRNN